MQPNVILCNLHDGSANVIVAFTYIQEHNIISSNYVFFYYWQPGIKGELTAVTAELCQLINAQKFKELTTDMFTEDCVIMPPNKEAVTGRKGKCSFSRLWSIIAFNHSVINMQLKANKGNC